MILVITLAFGRFPLVLPGRSTVGYLAAAVVAAVLFMASVLAHEVAHAIVARRNGIQVESITLWLFGGVAQLKGDPRSPGADLRIAAVGPLTSLALGIGLFLFGAGQEAGDQVADGDPLHHALYAPGGEVKFRNTI